MTPPPRKLTLEDWDTHYARLKREGLQEPWYGGPLSRHLGTEGDLRLKRLEFDDSPAALRLWNFLLTENQRLAAARAAGEKIVGAMKDLGTVPVLAYSLPGLRAFYPDGAWWTPCLMECTDGLLQRAEVLGVDASFCPVRAMLAAFDSRGHFPIPDLLVCSAGAVCDDFSAIAQRLEHRGFAIHWWEMPRRRQPEANEPACELPGGGRAPRNQVDLVRDELERIARELGQLAGRPLDDALLSEGIRKANRVRLVLQELRARVYRAPEPLLPALEMLICEMLALHFCSDLAETLGVLQGLLAEVRQRAEARPAAPATGVRIFWVNPVADLRTMNCVETWGGRICGSDYMFSHALDTISEDVPPFEALARTALADPMVGSAAERAARIVAECRQSGAEAVVVSRVPGASHSAYEGETIREAVMSQLNLPSVELEIPCLSDAMLPSVCSRLQALMETARARHHAR